MTVSTSVFRVQKSADRAYFDHGWLQTYHSFSFAEYYDPTNEHWGPLRVLNDDRVAPGQGFGLHPHRDMEIITYVLAGELEHRDSMGNRGVVGPGDVQYMSAGTGVRHSEFNHSASAPLHLVQMWVLPSKLGVAPSYGQQSFAVAERLNRWLAIASGEAPVAAPVRLTRDATFLVTKLDDASVTHAFHPNRLGFLFLADGNVAVAGTSGTSRDSAELQSGDAIRIAGLDELTLQGTGEALLWDLPALTS